MRHKLIPWMLLILFMRISDTAPAAPREPFATFFAVHMEAAELSRGAYQHRHWPELVALVAMADRYGAHLTLMFNPQWAEYILADGERTRQLRQWQSRGHEVALHYHNVYHGDWNGFTNSQRPEFLNDPRYRGPVAEMMRPLEQLAGRVGLKTMCMGPKNGADQPRAFEIEPEDYPPAVLYDVDGVNLGLSPVLRTRFRDRELLHLKHHFIAPHADRQGHLEHVKAEYERAQPSEVLGVVTHAQDFGASPDYFEDWFRYVSRRGGSIRTVADIVSSYPSGEIVDVTYLVQRGFTGGVPEALAHRVEKFQAQLLRCKERGGDTGLAERLAAESRRAFEAGDPDRAGRLLDRALRILEGSGRPAS